MKKMLAILLSLVMLLSCAAAAAETAEKTYLATVDMNGVFQLQCTLPEAYEIQEIESTGASYIALFMADESRPLLTLSIAYNELYSDVFRMNDLDAEDLALIEDSFKAEDDVKISYTETSYGTKLMVCREVGNDTDFVDIFSVYKGYNVEFIMQPNPKAKNQHLTDAQIKMCVDFLSEVDFISPDEIQSQTEAKPIVHHQRIIVGK